MKKIYLLLLSGSLLAACSKKEASFYQGYGSPVPNGSTINSNVRLVSLCTAPMAAPYIVQGGTGSMGTYVDHIFWDLVLSGKSQAVNGIGGYSLPLEPVNIVSGKIANPIPNNPLPNTLPANAPGAPMPPSGLIVTPYAIPDSLLDGSRRAHIQVNYQYSIYQYANHLKDSVVKQVDTTLANTAQDLYFYNHAFIGQYANVVVPSSAIDLNIKVFPRDVAVSDPTKFKIRVINLSHGVSGASAVPQSIGMVDVPLAGAGKVSLCYANATPVNTAATSNVAPGSASNYIELPYGTYQFKIMDERNVLVPGNSGQHNSNGGTGYSITGPAGDNFSGPYAALAYTPIRTYLPGGIYTLVVFDNAYSNVQGTNIQNVVEPEYEVIADNKPAANISYSKIQWANAMPGTTGVTLQLDGQNVQGALDFGNSSDYSIYNYGQHTLTLKDNSNNTLVTKTVQLPAMANYTIWAYASADNKPQLSFVANAMDLTNSGAQKGSEFNFACRFINYCPDVPFATFTANNFDGRTNFDAPVWMPNGPTNDASYMINPGPGVPTKAYQNLPFGQPVQDTAYLMPPNPITNVNYGGAGYVNKTLFYPLYKISAFSSQAYPTVVVPGDPIPDLVPLDRPFFANPAIYPNQNNQPYADAGVFTVALIGRIGDPNPARKARLMVIKHVQ